MIILGQVEFAGRRGGQDRGHPSRGGHRYQAEDQQVHQNLCILLVRADLPFPFPLRA